MNDNIKEVRWFSGRDTIGVVLIRNESIGYSKAYIGTGRGISESQDVEDIASYGTKIPQSMAESLFGDLPDYSL